MSDPIADILVGHCFMPPDHDNEPADIETAMAEQVAKQIRQQIGRELVTYIKEKEGDYRWAAGRNWIEPMLSEVCQLEEE